MREFSTAALSLNRSTSLSATQASSASQKCWRRRCSLARPGAKLVALVKPQFEAGREEVGKGGVVRDPVVHERVSAEAKAWIESQGWTVLGIVPSPITGPDGNVEFLLGAEKNG